MYENYASRFTIPPATPEIGRNKNYVLGPMASQFASNAGMYDLYPLATPAVAAYTDWRDESLSYHLTCSISENISGASDGYRFKGPDAVRLLKDSTVNKYDSFPVGTTKHVLSCTPEGYCAFDGVIMRLAEDEFEVSCDPYILYVMSQGSYDVEFHDYSPEKTLIQLQGPASLQVAEEALGVDLHDLEFNHIRRTSFNGVEVIVIRFGMANCIGYELHSYRADDVELVGRLLEVGRKYGARRLGFRAYKNNHVPGGSMQMAISYMQGLPRDEGYLTWMAASAGGDIDAVRAAYEFGITGSLGQENYAETFCYPWETGMGAMVDYNNPNFVGYEALITKKEHKERKMVTLLWNPEDICDVYASQFRAGEEPYDQMDTSNMDTFIDGTVRIEFDRVLDRDGNKIGYASGRTLDVYNQAMVSFAVIAVDQAELGNEVQVVWGREGYRQKLIRATVVKTPFNQHLANKSFDTSQVPRLGE